MGGTDFGSTEGSKNQDSTVPTLCSEIPITCNEVV